MPPITEARPRWQATLDHCNTLADLQRAVRYSGPDSPAVRGCRSLCWKIFLLFNDVSPASWVPALSETRASYTKTRDHLLRYIKNPEALTSLNTDPLSDDPNSPWNSVRQDEVIRGEIAQDVRRLPDDPFYHQEHIQTAIIDALFVYCKLNPTMGGYRQGMHELLAPIVYVIEHDAVDDGAVDDISSVSDSDRLMLQVLGRSFVEHDAFTLFSRVMDRAAPFYAVSDTTASASSPATQSSEPSAIVEKSKFIHEICLQKVDPELSQHLTNIEILPQIFLIRWIRLLFGREFPFDELLIFWDVMFAVDPRLELIDLICVAMLLRIRWELLEADYSVCLQLLLKFPTPSPPHGPHTFVDDALYLRNHLDPSGATSLLAKYTGKVPYAISSPGPTPNAQASAIPSFRTLGSLRARASSPRVSLPSRLVQHPGGMEALLQVAAKNVLERGEKLGINQAVREAMGEIRRNVQSLQEARPYPGRAAGYPLVAGGYDAGMPDGTAPAMERRNGLLAAMLEDSLTGLRAITAEDLDDRARSLEMIELAASKVQLVKAFLDDSSIDIPEPSPLVSAGAGDDADVVMESTQEADAEAGAGAEAKEPPPKGSNGTVVPDPIPAISSLSLSNQTPKPAQPAPVPVPSIPTPSSHPNPHPAAKPPRPKPLPTRSSIAQSSFAWMLEPERETSRPTPHGPSTSSSAGLPSPVRRAPRRTNAGREKNAFLFGEVVPSGDDGSGTGDAGKRDIFGLVDLEGRGPG